MGDHTCPVWVGYLLASPIRKLYQHPGKILGDLVQPGMTVLDVGCAMGYFSLPMARIAGSEGKVICLDLQEKMLEKLKKRAVRQGLMDRMECRTCSESSLQLEGLEGSVDAALAFAVVHEVNSSRVFFDELFRALRRGARLLLAEPRGHVTAHAFEQTLTVAESAGFTLVEPRDIRMSHGALLVRNHRPD